MAAVVLVVAAPPGVFLVAVSPEVGAVVGVVDLLVAHVVVARQHAVGQTRIVELLVFRVGVVPLPQLVVVVHDVAGVEQVLQVEVRPLGQQVVVDRCLVLVELLVVVLRVGFDSEGEVVLRAERVIGIPRLDRALA